MRSVVLLILITLATAQYNDTDMEEIEERRKQMLAPMVMNENLKRYNQICSMTNWACEKKCRQQYAQPTEQCVRPRDERCFDQPVHYNYTKDHSKPFPHELAVLRSFPKCWAHLSQLVCGSHFRPCGTHRFRDAGVSHFRMEVWQVYPLHLCSRAVSSCSFLPKHGIHLDLFGCQDAENELRTQRKLFDSNGQCKLRFSGINDYGHSMCMAPLVRVHSDIIPQYARPLVDECYVPCISSFVHEPKILTNFRSILLSTTILFTFVFGGVLVITLSKRPASKFVQFLNLNIFVFVCLLFGMWTYALVTHTTIENSAACEKAGPEYVRKQLPRGELDSCLIQSAAMQFLYMVSLIFLAIRLISILLPVQTINPKTEMCGNGLSLQSLIFITVMALSALCAVVGLWLRPETTDGLTGVCHVTLGPLRHSLAYYAPVSIVMVTLIALMIHYSRRTALPRSAKFGIALIVFNVIIFVATVVIHYFNEFDSATEVQVLQDRIRCILGITKHPAGPNFEWEAEVEKCSIQLASSVDLILIFSYVLLFPALPFVVYMIVSMTCLRRFDADLARGDPTQSQDSDKPLIPNDFNQEEGTVRTTRSSKRPPRIHPRTRSRLNSLRSKRSGRFTDSAPSRSLQSIQSGQLSRYPSSHATKDSLLYHHPLYFPTPASTCTAFNDAASQYTYLMPPSRADDFCDLDISDYGRSLAYLNLLHRNANIYCTQNDQNVVKTPEMHQQPHGEDKFSPLNPENLVDSERTRRMGQVETNGTLKDPGFVPENKYLKQIEHGEDKALIYQMNLGNNNVELATNQHPCHVDANVIVNPQRVQEKKVDQHGEDGQVQGQPKKVDPLAKFRFDPAIDENRSQILAFLTAYLRETTHVVKKVEFAQRTLKALQILLEKDEIFSQMCHKYVKDNGLNPGSHTLDGSILSINQMLNMTSLITDRNLLIRLAKIIGNAMHRVTQEMSGEPPKRSGFSFSAPVWMEQPMEGVEAERHRAWRQYQAYLSYTRRKERLASHAEGRDGANKTRNTLNRTNGVMALDETGLNSTDSHRSDNTDVHHDPNDKGEDSSADISFQDAPSSPLEEDRATTPEQHPQSSHNVATSTPMPHSVNGRPLPLDASMIPPRSSSSEQSIRLDGQTSQALDMLNAVNHPPYLFEGQDIFSDLTNDSPSEHET